MLRCMPYGGTTFKVISGNVVGHGEILDDDTYLKSVRIGVAADVHRGFIRNGSVVRITEVK